MAESKIKDPRASNNFGTKINISSYTSSYYTCPCDGYVVCEANASANSDARARIFPANSDSPPVYLGAISNGTYPAIPVFVRKGMRVRVDGAANNGSVSFIPIL